MYKMIKEVTKTLLPLFLIGIVYYIWIELTGITVPCVFRKMTGLRCPGCGLTTMCINLIHFDFVTAYHANKFVFCSIPLLIIGVMYYFYFKANEMKEPNWYKVCCIGYTAAFVLFGVVRNII